MALSKMQPSRFTASNYIATRIGNTVQLRLYGLTDKTFTVAAPYLPLEPTNLTIPGGIITLSTDGTATLSFTPTGPIYHTVTYLAA